MERMHNFVDVFAEDLSYAGHFRVHIFVSALSLYSFTFRTPCEHFLDVRVADTQWLFGASPLFWLILVVFHVGWRAAEVFDVHPRTTLIVMFRVRVTDNGTFVFRGLFLCNVARVHGFVEV